MKILRADFLYSVPHVDLLKSHKPTVIFLGRSNVGKSSFINALCHRKDLAKTSKSPGQTRHAVVYELLYQKGLREKKLFLIDLPGYGYAKMSKEEAIKSQELIDSILNEYDDISLICLLFDCRRDFDDREKEIINTAIIRKIPYIVILTKADKLSRSERMAVIKKMASFDFAHDKAIFHSNIDKTLSHAAIERIFGLIA